MGLNSPPNAIGLAGQYRDARSLHFEAAQLFDQINELASCLEVKSGQADFREAAAALIRNHTQTLLEKAKAESAKDLEWALDAQRRRIVGQITTLLEKMK